VYATCLFPLREDPQATLETWARLKQDASLAIQACGGTITHQHGIGRDHAPYLPAEKGPAGMTLLAAACQALDPQGILNPGVLLPAP
jgi:alkyldihydroxyacetonephosphate synthase